MKDISKGFNWGTISKYRTQIMGIACIWVVLFHNTFQTKGPRLIETILYRGNVGVDMFLFLSGIGLYFSYIKDRNIKAFYKRRINRLLIPYLVFAIPYYIWWTRLSGGRVSFVSAITNVAFVKNGITTTWFIPTILIFYLVFRLIFFLQNSQIYIVTKSVDRNNVTVILVFIYFLALRYMMDAHPTLWKHTEIALMRGVIFIIGCHAGEWVQKERGIPFNGGLIGFIWIVLYFIFRSDIKLNTFWARMSYAPFSIACTIFFAYLLEFFSKAFNIRKYRVLEFFGNRSLEIYLTHVMVKNIYSHYVGFPHFLGMGYIDYAIVVAIALILSCAGQWLTSKINRCIDYKR